LFEATLPGVQEELSFRGVWWVLLLSAFQNPTNSDRFPRETLVVTTILFGSVHALHILPGGGISIDWLIFAATATSGFFYGLIQANGKSLWIPISVHTAANLAILAVQSVMLPFHMPT
jgi:membrane protease YdiL (CAAX protease family)